MSSLISMTIKFFMYVQHWHALSRLKLFHKNGLEFTAVLLMPMIAQIKSSPANIKQNKW